MPTCHRVCPGKLLALAEIYLHLATLLKVYDIVEWKSEKDGAKIEIGEDRGPTMDMPRYVSTGVRSCFELIKVTLDALHLSSAL